MLSPGALIILILKEPQAPTVLVLDISDKRDPKALGQMKRKYFIKSCLALHFLNPEDDGMLHSSKL